MTVPADGGTPRQLAETDGTFGGLWLDDVGLIWTTYYPAAIWQMAR